jgi:hypothetical protein
MVGNATLLYSKKYQFFKIVFYTRSNKQKIMVSTKMEASAKEGVKVKLFAGFAVNSEMKMHLRQSSTWKNSRIDKNQSKVAIQETHYQEKDYLGIYLDAEKQTLPQLKEIENELRNQLAQYCPEFNIESIKLYIFPQIFIT